VLACHVSGGAVGCGLRSPYVLPETGRLKGRQAKARNSI
jgi:hypothetical protein